MAVLIQSIESIEMHRQKKKQKRTTTSDRLVNGARWAFQCFMYNTNKITDPF